MTSGINGFAFSSPFTHLLVDLGEDPAVHWSESFEVTGILTSGNLLAVTEQLVVLLARLDRRATKLKKAPS